MCGTPPDRNSSGLLRFQILTEKFSGNGTSMNLSNWIVSFNNTVSWNNKAFLSRDSLELTKAYLIFYSVVKFSRTNIQKCHDVFLFTLKIYIFFIIAAFVTKIVKTCSQRKITLRALAPYVNQKNFLEVKLCTADQKWKGTIYLEVIRA